MSGWTQEQRAGLAAADAAGRVFVTMVEGRVVLALGKTPDTEQGTVVAAEQIAKVCASLGNRGVETEPRPCLMIACSEAAHEYLITASEHCEIEAEFNEWALCQLVVCAAEELDEDPVKALAKYT